MYVGGKFVCYKYIHYELSGIFIRSCRLGHSSWGLTYNFDRNMWIRDWLSYRRSNAYVSENLKWWSELCPRWGPNAKFAGKCWILVLVLRHELHMHWLTLQRIIWHKRDVPRLWELDGRHTVLGHLQRPLWIRRRTSHGHGWLVNRHHDWRWFNS